MPVPRAKLLICRAARVRDRLQDDRVEILRHLLMWATADGKLHKELKARALRVLHHFSHGLERSGADIESLLNVCVCAQ